jgi:hypothetical protein
MLLLSWLAPSGGRGIVALDLLNCSSVQSAPSPTHPSARDDVGTVAARIQSQERGGQPLMDMLVPFHMVYADGVERLAAESLLERQKWVNRIWYVFCIFFLLKTLTLLYVGMPYLARSRYPTLNSLAPQPRPFEPSIVTQVPLPLVRAQQSSFLRSTPFPTSQTIRPKVPLSDVNSPSRPHTTPARPTILSFRMMDMSTRATGVSSHLVEETP